MGYFVMFSQMPEDPPSFQISAPFGKWMETRQSPRYFWRNKSREHSHFVIIQWTHSGKGEATFGGEIHETTPDTALIAIVPEESAYYYPPDGVEPWVFSWINFYGDLGIRVCHGLRDTYGPILPLRREEAAGKALSALIRQAEQRVARDVHDTSVDVYSFLMAWSRSLSRPSRRVDPVEAAMQICRTRFREPLAIKQLADETGVTREHLTREFLRKARISPAQYLRRLRVRAARQLLEEYKVTQAEAALRCGFPSPKAMMRAFAQKF